MCRIFNGIVVEQYKILWDYGEELKRTNPSSTMKIEGQCHTYKRLYMFGGLQKKFQSQVYECDWFGWMFTWLQLVLV